MEYRCPKCNEELQIANSQIKSEVGATDVYTELTMVCPNPKCDNYVGVDRNNPKFVVETVKNKIG